MKGLTRTKKLEVAQYYVLGHSYKRIEDETKVSHGSVVNIVKEVESGQLTVPGVPLDQINDLRRLSSELRQKGLGPSQALLGISFFGRLQELGVGPEDLSRWSELVKRWAPADFPAKDFFESAARLHELEQSAGKPFEELAEEHARLTQGNEQLGAQAESLEKRKAVLLQEVQSLSAQTATQAERAKAVRNSVDTGEAKLKELSSAVKKASEEKTSLAKQIREFERRMARLRSEVDGKEESLKRLNELGFSDEDLLRLSSLVEKMARAGGVDTGDTKSDFFRALDCFGSLSELRKTAAAEADTIKKIREEQSSLAGEIAKLESIKAALHGEVCDSASLASKKIQDASEKAVSQIEQETEAIRNQLKAILVDILTAGGAVSEMRAMEKKGEESCRELEDFLREAKGRVEGR